MKIIKDDIRQWLAYKFETRFQRLVSEDIGLAWDIVYHGHTGYKDFSDEAIIEEIDILDLLEDAINEGYLSGMADDE